MTIGIAAQGDGWAVLAADSQLTMTRGGVVTRLLVNKIQRFGPHLFGMWAGKADWCGWESDQIMDLPKQKVTVTTELAGVEKVYEFIRMVHDKHVKPDTAEDSKHPHALILSTLTTPTIYRATEKGVERAEPGQEFWVAGWHIFPVKADNQAAGEREVVIEMYSLLRNEKNAKHSCFPIVSVSAGPDGAFSRRWEEWNLDPNMQVLDSNWEEET